MISYPNAKINLGLNIIEKRADGFHEIESVFYPIDWKDILEIVPSGEVNGMVEFSSSGIEIPESNGGNLCERAYQILHDRYALPSVKIHLHKVIPIGAGLGGGSADASFTLKMLNELFDLRLPDQELETFAAELGSDCPFFIENVPKFVTGRGEEMEPIEVDLSSFCIVLINPNIHIGTAEAYANVSLGASQEELRSAINFDPEYWGNAVKNDFEVSLFPSYPKLAELKARLLAMGASYAAMTGSGSTVFGLFKGEIPDLSEFSNYLVKVC